MPELHLKQPGFTYSAFGQFTKNYERIQKLRETSTIKNTYMKKRIRLSLFCSYTAYSDTKFLDKNLKTELMKFLEIVTMMDIK